MEGGSAATRAGPAILCSWGDKCEQKGHLEVPAGTQGPSTNPVNMTQKHQNAAVYTGRLRRVAAAENPGIYMGGHREAGG